MHEILCLRQFNKAILITALYCGVLQINLSAQNQTIEQYIEKFKDAAIQNMQNKRIPASITLAQGILESGAGNSPLAINSNNHFGIKCHKEWTGEKYFHDDDAPQECFRKYASVSESYADHADFLISRPRYANLFKLNILDYKGWARELKAAGYATLPTYPEKLIGYIEKYKLYKYDSIAEFNQAFAGNSNLKNNDIIYEAKNEFDDNKAINKVAEPEVKTIRPVREIKTVNGVNYIVAVNGDNPKSIAAEFELAEWQIRRYNDLKENQKIAPGDIVFIMPKKAKSEEFSEHVIQEGESLRDVANKYGIKLHALKQFNGISKDDSIEIGTVVKLQ